MVYEETSGLYYHYKSGYYFDAATGLYYDGHNGVWYQYDSETGMQNTEKIMMFCFLFPLKLVVNPTRLPPGPTWIKSWYHSKFQLILAIFGLLILKLFSDKSRAYNGACIYGKRLYTAFSWKFGPFVACIWLPKAVFLKNNSK